MTKRLTVWLTCWSKDSKLLACKNALYLYSMIAFQFILDKHQYTYDTHSLTENTHTGTEELLILKRIQGYSVNQILQNQSFFSSNIEFMI